MNLILLNVNYDEIFLHNPYWITSSKVSYEDKVDAKIQHDSEMERMKSYLQNNNNLGLGFTFRKGEKKIDYDFKIKIDKVFVYCETPADGNYKCVDTLKIIK